MAASTVDVLLLLVALLFNYLFFFADAQHRNYWITGFITIVCGAIWWTFDSTSYYSWVIILTGFGLILSPKLWNNMSQSQ